VQAFEAARAIVVDLIAEREASPREDFISGLIIGRRSGDEPISDEEITANVFAICAAAMTTTSTTTAMTLLSWMRHRDQFELIRSEPEPAVNAVEESLRLHPAGLFVFPRFAVHDAELGGTAIPADLPVHVCVAAADLDPDVYADPLRFDIRRNPKHSLVADLRRSARRARAGRDVAPAALLTGAPWP
jgi:cytochrome P450